MAWKVPFMSSKFFSPKFFNEKEKICFLKVRNSYIPYKWKALNIAVYNGKVFILLKVKMDMLKFKLGEFSIPIKMGYRRKKKKQNKKSRKK